MSIIFSTYKKIDKSLETSKKWIVGIGILLITILILLGVLLRTFFNFSFSWLEEICQYLMVWIICISCSLSVRNDEHVGVDIIFSILPKKYHSAYKFILTVICSIFMFFFTRYTIDIMVKVQKTNQTSVSMPWLKMYLLHLGVVIGNVLMFYEYIKAVFQYIGNFLNKGHYIKDQKV